MECNRNRFYYDFRIILPSLSSVPSFMLCLKFNSDFSSKTKRNLNKKDSKVQRKVNVMARCRVFIPCFNTKKLIACYVEENLFCVKFENR